LAVRKKKRKNPSAAQEAAAVAILRVVSATGRLAIVANAPAGPSEQTTKNLRTANQSVATKASVESAVLAVDAAVDAIATAPRPAASRPRAANATQETPARKKQAVAKDAVAVAAPATPINATTALKSPSRAMIPLISKRHRNLEANRAQNSRAGLLASDPRIRLHVSVDRAPSLWQLWARLSIQPRPSLPTPK
jgi:hypothetical protein